MTERDVEHPSIAFRAFGQALQPARGEIEVQDGFRIGIHARRPIGRALSHVTASSM